MKRKIIDIFNLIFGFRKFLLILILYLIGVVFRIKGLISGAEMVELFTGTTIAFFGANGLEHLVSLGKEYVASKSKVNETLTTPKVEE